jgi:hypothetical protein
VRIVSLAGEWLLLMSLVYLPFLLGTMAVTGDLLVAIACAVAMTVLLALRDQLHRWVASLTWPEIRAVLVIAICRGETCCSAIPGVPIFADFTARSAR